MKKYGVNELRKMYLDFFRSKDHLVMNSFSLQGLHKGSGGFMVHRRKKNECYFFE